MLEMEIRRFDPLDYQANEALNTLCTNLFFAGGDIKKIMVTSCHPQEGKSFVTMNLMRSLGRLGMKVVLVDADIRASALRGMYDIHTNLMENERYMGLTRYLAGKCSIEDILAQTNIANAWMILSGRNVTNSLPLLSSPRLGNLLATLSRSFDVVLVDAPPVGTVIDAAKIAGACDGTLFVVQSGTVRHRELQEAMLQMEKTGTPILGSVLNQFDEHIYGDKYYHKSYYSKYETGYGKNKQGASVKNRAKKESLSSVRKGEHNTTSKAKL